jgi:hypothetical protein
MLVDQILNFFYINIKNNFFLKNIILIYFKKKTLKNNYFHILNILKSR